ncbi:MAG: hypothetical protein AABN33_03875 [Acidobacteriota bacterium]
MNDILTHCPRCRCSLEIPPDFDNVICRGCATAYWVRRHGGVISLSEIWPEEENPLRATNTGMVIERRLADIDELIEEAESEIAALRSGEQSAPLQMGCAFFGLFMMIIMVSALFMMLGKKYFGSWMYYASIAAVILFGLARIRHKSVSPLQREKLRQDRLLMEDGLAQLETERNRIEKLKASLNSEETDREGPGE